MIISCCMICVFLLIFALNDKYDWSNVLQLICIFLYQLGFGLGMGPVPWFIIPEYFKVDVRSTATMMVTASNWIFAFLVTLVWPYMKDGMGMFGALIFFVCISFCTILFSAFCIREPDAQNKAINDDQKDTKNKEEEEEEHESV